MSFANVFTLRASSALLGFVIVCSSAVSIAYGDQVAESAIKSAHTFVADSHAKIRLDAETKRRREEVQYLQDAAVRSDGANVFQKLGTIDSELSRHLVGSLQTTSAPLVSELERAAADAAKSEAALAEEWQAVRSNLHKKQVELFQVQAGKRIAGQFASLLSVDNRWFWLFGLIAFASLMGILFHDRRHEVRRWLYGGTARAMGASKILTGVMVFFAVMTLVIFIFGDRLFNALLLVGSADAVSPVQQFAQDNAALETSLKELRAAKATVDDDYQREFAKWKQANEKYPLFDPAALDSWSRSRAAVAALQVGNSVQTEVAAQLQADVARLKTLETEMVSDASAITSFNRTKQWIRTALGISFAAMVFAGGYFVRRGILRRRERMRNTCPLCLGENTFQPVDQPGLGARHSNLEMVRCTNVLTEQPFEECNFTFMAAYREMAKICFPTLGVPSTGKSHWLAMVYRELNRGNFPELIQFERIRSEGSNDFDRIVDDILDGRMGPGATQTDRISDPLIFNFLDRDRLGASQTLVNIFDFSGEVTQRMTLEDQQRRRALDADGFFFFLDPTKPSEIQSSELARFREDLRRIKGVKAGGQIHTPVALCMSKIDLMINEPYADPDGGGVVGNFYRDLGEIGWEMDLNSIAARSKLVSRLRDTIWPGWQIERQIHDLFGGRFMFFPLTPVGLNGLGESDLSSRTIAPVGLLDPLMWLLHMNGYPVLK